MDTEIVYTRTVKNITLSAEEDLIQRARLRAAKEKRTLNAAFRDWLQRERANESSQVLTEEDREALTVLDSEGWWQDPHRLDAAREPLMRAAAWYFLRARNKRGTPVDSVARFHLGNGARLERLNWLADTSERALRQSFGLMVNYLYDLADIEKNHEAYAQQRTIAAASAVTRLARTAQARDVVPAEA